MIMMEEKFHAMNQKWGMKAAEAEGLDVIFRAAAPGAFLGKRRARASDHPPAGIVEPVHGGMANPAAGSCHQNNPARQICWTAHDDAL